MESNKTPYPPTTTQTNFKSPKQITLTNQSNSMKQEEARASTYINGVHTKNKKKQEPPIWKYKGLKLTADTEKPYSITDFIHENAPKVEDTVLGPGAGAGVGCGVGVGFGLVGGVGFGGSVWNHVRVAFGFGVGCGVGVGFGFGQGFGYGSRWETMKARIVKPPSGSKKRVLIQI